jgi:PAS domain S-box-containing protein
MSSPETTTTRTSTSPAETTHATAEKTKMPTRPLQVLLVEDSENDATLLELELERAGFASHCERVETAEAMAAALTRQTWDLVIADYVMPHFNGLAALALLKSKGQDIPFIIVSGHITDDTAVAAMKAGAHDYVMKDNLVRLGPAVDRELREAEVRRARRRTEERLKVEHTFREAIENSVPAGITAVDLDGRQTYVNPAFCDMVGWSEAELVGARPPFVYWPKEDLNSIMEAMAKVISGEAPTSGLELRYRRPTGERIDVLLQITPLKDAFGNITGWVTSASDITERRKAEVRLAAEHAITRILANALSLEEAGPGIVQVLMDGLEVDVGTLWSVDEKRALLYPSVTNLRQGTEALQEFLNESRRNSFAAGTGVPGTVWQTRQLLWMSDLRLDARFSRREIAAKAGLLSGVAFPIHSGKRCFGVLEFLTLRRLENDPTMVNMMTAIGSEIGQFIQRREAEEALRRAHDELEIRVHQRTADLKLANAKLHASIAERRRLEHELLEITEKERRRIGLDLHDDLGQKLSGIALMTKGLELRLARENATGAVDAGNIHSLVQEAMSHTSDLAHDLATLEFKSNDLPAALESLAARARQLFQITCRVKAEGDIPPLEPNVISQLYKIAQESLTNAIKHGKAKRVTINLSRENDGIVLAIQNTGLPFPDLKSKSTGMGLRIMNYRANLINAHLEVKGLGERGTLVTCILPIEQRR